jgi:Flp pilus assembly protein TadG
MPLAQPTTHRSPRRPVPRFRHDRRGASAVEAAIILPVLLGIMGGLTDTGLLWQARGQLAAAVSAGVEYALLAGTGATPTTVQGAMSAATSLTPLTVLATGPSCYCVTSGSTALPSTTSTCASTCPDKSIAGSYMTLSAKYTYNPIMPGYSKMVATQRNEQATVRLQ